MTIMGSEASETAAQVIAEHGLSALTGACRCGYEIKPGQHPQHVLHELQMAGIDVVWR